jgi:tetratricopeptide (TPR) repeat protein
MDVREAEGRRRRGWGKALRGGLWGALSLLCAVMLRDAVLGTPPLDCQEAVRRSGSGGAVEAACREQYFSQRDPEDGLALARALLRRGELRGTAAVAQGLLLTPARADALGVLSAVAQLEGRFDEAQRALGQAAELHAQLERRREAAVELLERGRRWLARGLRRAAAQDFARAAALARQAGDAALEGECLAAAEGVRRTEREEHLGRSKGGGPTGVGVTGVISPPSAP